MSPRWSQHALGTQGRKGRIVISLKDLQFLTALARHGHFARAAEEVGVSQPAFSMRIRKLEETLDAAIVKRGNRFQGFTAEGDALMRHARKIMDNVQLLEEDFRSAGGTITGTLTLGVIPTAVAYVAQALQTLRAAHPGITVRLQAATSLAVQQGLENGRFDAGLTYEEGVPPDLQRVEPLYEETYLLLSPTALAPRAGGSASWTEAAQLPLILLEPGMQNRRILDVVFRDLGILPNVIAETSEFTSAMVMAANGIAATIVPKVLLHALGGLAGTVALPLVDPILAKQVCLISAHRTPGLSTVDALRRCLGVMD